MKFLPIIFSLATLLTLGALAAPVPAETEFDELEARATNLAISLKEWKKNKPNGQLEEWHFGLVTHAPGAIPAAGQPRAGLPLYHWIIDGQAKCMAFEAREKPSKTDMGSIITTAKLIPAKGEADDAALTKAIEAAFKTIGPSKVREGAPFSNCLDSVLAAMTKLYMGGYIGDTDYKGFQSFWLKKQKEVRTATDSMILKECQLAKRDFEDDDMFEARAASCKLGKKQPAAGKGKQVAGKKLPVVGKGKQAVGKGKPAAGKKAPMTAGKPKAVAGKKPMNGKRK